MLKKTRTAVFDLDGTLHHTEMALVPAIQMAMVDLGFEPASPDAINALYGEPLEVFCRELLGDVSRFCSDFRSGVKRHQLETLPLSGALYEGTEEMLRQLRDMGFELAICSNAGTDYIHLVTSTLSIDQYFSLMVGRDGNASKSRRLGSIIEGTGSDFSVMIGDRYHDIQAAVENGILSIGCLYGYGSMEEMEPADHVVNHPMEIVTVLRDICGT